MARLDAVADSLTKGDIPEKPQSVLIYGAPKTGKTVLAAQLAVKYNVIWIDAEKGSQTLFHAIPKEFWKNLDLIELMDTNESPRGIRMLTKLFKAGMQQGGITKLSFCAAHGDIMCPLCTKFPAGTTFDPANADTKTVLVVDPLSRISDSAMSHALGQQGDMVFRKKEFSHYDNQGLLLKSILTMQQFQKYHRVFISHEEQLDHEDGTTKITPMAGTRNFARRVAGYFDHVIYTSIRNKKYCVSSLGTSDIKVQSGNRNNIDIKSVDDFINIFSTKHLLEGKASNLSFSHEASEIESEETQKAAASE